MKRQIMSQLLDWKARKNRIPLIIKGVRQCGKTYVLKEFGKNEFPNVHYFNFEQDNRLALVFEGALEPQRILFELNFLVGTPINPGTDLIVFDEIQACTRALTALKYFCEDMPEAAICAAGSLLGLHLNDGSFPVGKVEFLHLHPMSFEEFLLAIGQVKLFDFIMDPEFKVPVPESIHLLLWEHLKTYYVVGGMPAAINTYIEFQENPFIAFEHVRNRQQDLITAYLADIAKHAGKVNAMHIDRIWQSVPAQLARAQDNRTNKFKFKGILPGVDRYQRMADAIDWLCAAELVIKVPIVETARLPLTSHAVDNRFKLYMNDVGLLGALSQLPVKSILDQDYGTYKGYYAENYVAQALICADNKSLYAWEDGRAEVEFLRILGGEVIPVEVKSGKVTKAQSLQAYSDRYHPPYRIIYSAKSGGISVDGVHHYPIYLAGLQPDKR